MVPGWVIEGRDEYATWTGVGSVIEGPVISGETLHGTNRKRHIKSHAFVLNTHVHLMTTNTWTPPIDPASQELTGVTSKREHQL